MLTIQGLRGQEENLKALRLIGILLVLISPGVSGQNPDQKVNPSRPAIIERTVQIGDYRFHYKDQGEGSPAVVLDAGLCQSMDTWRDVPAQISTFARVFTYDRPGLGSSAKVPPLVVTKPAGKPELRTSRQIVEELRALLRKAGVTAPYLLVGHSFGGINVRLYASMYPNDVAGIALIDSSNEDQHYRYAALMSPAERRKYLLSNRGANCEFIDLDASSAQLHEAAPLPHIPVTVISAPPEKGDLANGEAHLELQADLARRSASSVHIFAEGSGHFIQRDRPDVVIKAIRELVDRVRNMSIPLPTEADLKETRILHISIPNEAIISVAALTLSGLVGWRWRKRKRKEKAEMNRAQRRQAKRGAK